LGLLFFGKKINWVLWDNRLGVAGSCVVGEWQWRRREKDGEDSVREKNLVLRVHGKSFFFI
jgi:hypothetical protein